MSAIFSLPAQNPIVQRHIQPHRRRFSRVLLWIGLPLLAVIVFGLHLVALERGFQQLSEPLLTALVLFQVGIVVLGGLMTGGRLAGEKAALVEALYDGESEPMTEQELVYGQMYVTLYRLRLPLALMVALGPVTVALMMHGHLDYLQRTYRLYFFTYSASGVDYIWANIMLRPQDFIEPILLFSAGLLGLWILVLCGMMSSVAIGLQFGRSWSVALVVLLISLLPVYLLLAALQDSARSPVDGPTATVAAFFYIALPLTLLRFLMIDALGTVRHRWPIKTPRRPLTGSHPNPQYSRFTRQPGCLAHPRAMRAFLFIVAFYLLAMLASYPLEPQISWNIWGIFIYVVMLVGISAPLLIASHAAGVAARDVTAANFELIYLTPLSNWQLVWGYVGSTLWQLRTMFWLLVAAVIGLSLGLLTPFFVSDETSRLGETGSLLVILWVMVMVVQSAGIYLLSLAFSIMVTLRFRVGGLGNRLAPALMLFVMVFATYLNFLVVLILGPHLDGADVGEVGRFVAFVLGLMLAPYPLAGLCLLGAVRWVRRPAKR